MITISIGTKERLKNTQTSFSKKTVNSMKEFAGIIKNYSHSSHVWKNGQRAKENFQSTDMAMIDVDDGCSIPQFQQMFQEYSYLIMTSKSHQKEKKGKVCDRFHVYFPLQSRCVDGNFYTKAMKAFCDKYKFVDNKASVDTARFYFESPEAQFFANKGVDKFSLFNYAKPDLTNHIIFDGENKAYTIDDIKKSKKDTQVCCPWHGDSTPSARLYYNADGRISFHCFTCDITIHEPETEDTPITEENMDEAKGLLDLLNNKGVVLFMDKLTSEYNIYEDRVAKVIGKNSFVSVVQSIYFNLTNSPLKLSNNSRNALLTCIPRYYKVFEPHISERIYGDKFNIYEDRGIEPSTTIGEFPNIECLFRGLLTDDTAYEHFINYLACFYRTKIPSDCSWIFKGDQGTGKNLMYDKIIKPLFGIEWCGQASVMSSSITFNSIVANKRWVLFNEVFGGSSNKFANKTLLSSTAKQYIGRDAEFIVNEKHKAERLYRNQANYLFFSNEFSPLMIEKTNRRFIVIETGEPLKDRVDDIDFLITSIEKEIPLFAKYLCQYPIDVKKYNNKISTEAEMALIQDTMGRFQSFKVNMFDSNWLLERLDDRFIPQECITYLSSPDFETKFPTSLAYQIFTSIFADEQTTKHTFLSRMRSMGAKMEAVPMSKGRMFQYFTKDK